MSRFPPPPPTPSGGSKSLPEGGGVKIQVRDY